MGSLGGQDNNILGNLISSLAGQGNDMLGNLMGNLNGRGNNPSNSMNNSNSQPNVQSK